MCQSATTSLIAWIIATIIALLIISTGKKNGIWNGVFILTFILIQLLEFFVWRERSKLGLSENAEEAKMYGKSGTNVDNMNRPSGETYVRLILIGLWLQPLVQTFMAARYGDQRYHKQLMVATIAYFVMFIWAITQALDQKESFQASPNDETGHLNWSRTTGGTASFVGPGPAGMLYVFGLFFGLFFMMPTIFGLMLTTIGGVMVVYIGKNYRGKDFSSMWCLYAIFYAILAFMITYSTRVGQKSRQ